MRKSYDDERRAWKINSIFPHSIFHRGAKALMAAFGNWNVLDELLARFPHHMNSKHLLALLMLLYDFLLVP